MENLEDVKSVELPGGMTLGEILTMDFLVYIVGQVVLAGVILIAGFFIAGFVRRRIVNFSERSEFFDKTLGRFLASLARYSILTITIIFVLQQFGLQTTSLVALVGAAGLAIGLALQGGLSGVASGVMLVLFRPVKVGDFLEVNGHMGTVQDITIFTTELAAIGNIQIIIPNSQVWGNANRNYSGYDKRRAEWTFGVSYGSDLAKAEEIIRTTIMNDPRSMSDPEPFLQVNTLNDSSVDFLVRVWVKAEDYFQYQADMKRQVKEAFDAGGIEIPFPTQTVVHIGNA